MISVRQPAVADMFYPANPHELHRMVVTFLNEAPKPEQDMAIPKAIVAPHAGYIYSGPIAATAYARIKPAKGQITRVVLLGPTHRVPLYGCACSTAQYFATPLGNIPLDRKMINDILALPFVQELDEAHALEHSLEVHLPFLQEVLTEFQLVPIVVGDCAPAQVGELLERVWGGSETLIVVSSDLSHYHDYDTAKRMDSATSQAIEGLDVESIDSQHACGVMPLRGLLQVAKKHRLRATTIDCRNSGDTAGPRNQVVGYGAYVFEQ
jgi:AmmeMemoRadiSam system protein B